MALLYIVQRFCQSGNPYKVAFFLNALGQPWDPVFVDFMNGATRTDDWRASTNEMGEAPVLEDGTRRLTQSGLILGHLARKHGAFEGRTEEEKLETQRWILFDNHKFTSYFATYRFMKAFGSVAPDPAIMSWLRGRMDAAFSVVDKHLQDRAFMVGGQPTIADFSMCGYLFYPKEESGYDFAERYPQIGAWVACMRGIPGWEAPYDILPGGRLPVRW